MSGDPMWISVTEMMLKGPEEITTRLSGIADIQAAELVRYVNRAQRLYSIRDIELHDENISGEDKTVDVVVDIFNPVNSGRTRRAALHYRPLGRGRIQFYHRLVSPVCERSSDRGGAFRSDA